MNNNPLSVVVLGHVDHGKSSVIGRLVFETNSLSQLQKDAVTAASQKRGQDIEYSYVLDMFQAERDQAVTIDTTQIGVHTANHSFVMIDAPGHEEFIKNMVSGAAQAEAALFVIDAAQGLQEQTKRYAALLPLLGIRDVVIAVNKMDTVAYDEKRFHTLCDDIKAFISAQDIAVRAIMPVSARTGDMIVTRGDALSWYEGETLAEALDLLASEFPRKHADGPLRFVVQDVYRQGGQRIIVGRVHSGSLRVNDTVLISPSDRSATVISIPSWPYSDNPLSRLNTGQSGAMILDNPVFVERGDIISHHDNAPVMTNLLHCQLFWLDQNPANMSRRYTLCMGPTKTDVAIRKMTPPAARYDMTDVIFKSSVPLPLDNGKNAVLRDGYHIVAFGRITVDGFADQRRTRNPVNNVFPAAHLTDPAARAMRNGHKGGVFWLTGLSASGKTTLAMAAERRLFDKGYQVYVLDGDNIRRGLNNDLGFSDHDRQENIRRIGEVAALMADAGMIVITAFISPFENDRIRARHAADMFHEIYLNADLKTCESRDPKGLYKKARQGDISDFTGIDSPYEPPQNPDLVIDTARQDITASVAALTNYIEIQTALTQDPCHAAL